MSKQKNGSAKPNGDATPEEKRDDANHKPEDAAECFLAAREIKQSIARQSQKLSATYARFENLGVDVEAVKECLKLDKHEDAPGKLKRIMTMAAILNIIPTATEENGQLSVMPGLTVQGLNDATKERVALAKAYDDGYNTGLVGGSETNNKYQAGTEHRVKWSLGHIDGQAQRAIRKPGSENITQAPAERRGRGRPRKDQAPVDDRTQLEKDEASYRGVAPVTGTIQ